MSEISSVTPSAAAIVARKAADLNKAANASFASALSKVQYAVGLGPKTGFTAGPTYEAHTLAGQAKTVFNNALSSTKTALHIKP